MKNYTKILGLSLILALSVFTFAGCNNGKSSTSQGEKPKVVATIFPIYDFLREIGGDKIDLVLLMPPGGETHSFEPTPQDMKTVDESNLFVYVGGDSDSWVEKILSSNDEKKSNNVTIMDCVDTLDEDLVEGMTDEDGNYYGPSKDYKEAHSDDQTSDNHQGDEEHEKDEHVWTSPENAIKICEKLSDELSKVDPDNANYYKDNCNAYVKKLENLDSQFKDVVKNGKRNEIIFGDRFPFRYFVERYGLKYYAAFPGCSSDTEANANTIAFLTKKVEEDNIPAVLHIELSNKKIAESIAESTGAKVLQLNAVHNVTKEDFDKGESYLSLMEKNVETLKEALN